MVVNVINFVLRFGLITALLYKVMVGNDITMTLEEDPMELWLALSMVYLLTHIGPNLNEEQNQ